MASAQTERLDDDRAVVGVVAHERLGPEGRRLLVYDKGRDDVSAQRRSVAWRQIGDGEQDGGAVALVVGRTEPMRRSPSTTGVIDRPGHEASPTVSMCAFRQRLAPPPLPGKRTRTFGRAGSDLDDTDLGPLDGFRARGEVSGDGRLARRHPR